jgi:hypothetical protein
MDSHSVLEAALNFPSFPTEATQQRFLVLACQQLLQHCLLLLHRHCGLEFCGLGGRQTLNPKPTKLLWQIRSGRKTFLLPQKHVAFLPYIRFERLCAFLPFLGPAADGRMAAAERQKSRKAERQ